MKDAFSNQTTTLTAPLADAFSITPHDVSLLREVTRAVYVGQSGDLAVRFAGGGEVVLRGLKAGTIYPLRLTGVNVTGTTASDCLGLI